LIGFLEDVGGGLGGSSSGGVKKPHGNKQSGRFRRGLFSPDPGCECHDITPSTLPTTIMHAAAPYDGLEERLIIVMMVLFAQQHPRILRGSMFLPTC